MAQLDNIVEVVIDRQTSSVARTTFGVPLIIGDSTIIPGRTALYTSTAAMDDDGWAGTEPEYKAAAKVFAQNPHPTQVVVGRKKSPDTNYADTLSAVQLERNDWYVVIAEPHAADSLYGDVLAISGWVEAAKKMYVTSTSEAHVADTTLSGDAGTIAKQLKALGYERTLLLFSADEANYPEAAFVGNILPREPGSYTGDYKTMAGVAVDALTDTKVANCHEKNVMTYTEVAGVNITRNSKVSRGEWVDVMVFVDWLKARIQERIYARLVNLAKIPFTDAGIAVVEAEVKAQLKEGVASGGLSDNPAPTTTVPLAADVSALDKADRFLPDVEFSAILAGAIHKTKIHGVVAL